MRLPRSHNETHTEEEGDSFFLLSVGSIHLVTELGKLPLTLMKHI